MLFIFIGFLVHIYSFHRQVFFLTTTINQLTTGALNNMVAPLPSLEEQNQIVTYLNQETSKIDTAIDKHKQLIEKLKEYRSSIISHAVTGKIDVRDLAA